ncbi:MAG: hypothetical protein GY928_33815 [Colwellia sp.]|nr:hypothetical protein [Colwellia sp.]
MAKAKAFDDGKWYASTIGHLASIIIDGDDSAVCFRVVEDSVPGNDGYFVRKMEIVLLPNGVIGDFAKKCSGVQKDLKALLKKGVLK